MKKIFFAIGFLLSVYSVYFMLCVADYQLFMNDKHYYDMVLENAITVEELAKYAKECDVVIQVREYLNIEPGKYEINIYALNLDKKGWDKASLFPNNKTHIITEISDNKYKELVSIFMVQSDNKSEVDNLIEVLETDGHNIDIEMSTEGDSSFKFHYMFNENNVKLFSLMFVLIVFSSIIYYLTRTKEIGIRKLQGCHSFYIAVVINRRIAGWSLIGVIPVSAIFIIYICIMNIADLFQYLYMLFLLISCLMIVYMLATVGSSLVISRTQTISAIKANKNEKLLLFVLLITKIINTVLFCMIIYSTINDIYNTNDIIKNAEKLKKFDFYSIVTADIDDNEIETLNNYLCKIDDDYVYNYEPPLNLYSKSSIKKVKRIENIEWQCEENMMRVSYNLLDKLDIKLKEKINVNEYSGYTLLLPQYMKNGVKEVLSYFELGNDTNVIFIDNDQVINDLMNSGCYIYNPVVLVQPIVKGLYINTGEILYDKDAVYDISEYLEEHNYSRSRIYVQSVNEQIDASVGNSFFKLFENVFMGIIVIMAFCITSYAFVVATVQYRKKKIAIYALNGNRPESVIAIYMAGIMVIDIVIAIVWMWQLSLIVFLELLYASLEIHKLLENGVTRVINGE